MTNLAGVGMVSVMRAASAKHASGKPISADLRMHCIASRLLRVTPRPRAWQILLAT